VIIVDTEGDCPTCGHDVLNEIEGSCLTCRCPSCGWEVATTSPTLFPPILQDETSYEVLVLKNLSPSRAHYKLLSRLSGKNYLELKELLAGGELSLFKGRAPKVLLLKTELERGKVAFRINPEFNYSDSDASNNALAQETTPAYRRTCLTKDDLGSNQELYDFLNERFYRDYLLIVDDHLSEKMDMEFEAGGIILNIICEKMEKAGVGLEDIKWLINNHGEKAARYMAMKSDFYREPDGGEDAVINLPPDRSFPVGHLVEYFLILKKPEELPSFLQSCRMPYARRYAKEILKMFDDVQQA